MMKNRRTAPAKPVTTKAPAEQVVKDIRRATRTSVLSGGTMEDFEMTIVIHHNPDCSTSRNVLAILEAGGGT